MTKEKTNRIQLKWVMGTALAATLFVSLGTAQPTESIAKAEAKPEALFAAKAEAKPEVC